MTASSGQIEIRLIDDAGLNIRHKWRFYVACTVFLSGLAVCASIAIAGEQLTVPLAAISLLLPGLVACGSALEGGIFHPAALFSAFFAAYNGLLLLRFALPEVQQRLVYPTSFNHADLFFAAIASILASLSIACVWVMWPPTRVQNQRHRDVAGWFGVGLAFCAIGIALYFLEFAQIGGYWSSISTPRVERLDMLLNDTLSLPFLPSLTVGLVMMTVWSFTKRRGQWWIVSIFAIWSTLELLQGDRRMVVGLFLSVCGAARLVSAAVGRLRWRHLVGVALAFCAFALFGQVRFIIPALASRGVSLQTISDSADAGLLMDSIKPENTEFAGPYFSVLENVSERRPRLWGKTYIDSLFTVLPRKLYPGTKPVSPANVLAQRVNAGSGAAAGWGYSPIAEAILNFGLPGVPLVLGLLMSFFCWLGTLRNRRWGIVVAAVLIPQCMNVNRIDFRTVYLESFFACVFVLVAAGVVKSLGLFRPRVAGGAKT